MSVATIDEQIMMGTASEDDVVADILRSQAAAEAAKKAAREAAAAQQAAGPVIDIPSPAQPAPKPPAPKVEVVQPNRKLLVVFPAENRSDIRVAAYEDVAGGGKKVLEGWRIPTDYERKHLVKANKEYLSGSDGGAAESDAGPTMQKVWKYGKWVLVGAAVLGGGYVAANHFGLIGGDED